MLDKKKLFVLGVIAFIIIGALVAVIIWLSTSSTRNAPAEPTPGATPSSSAAADDGFTKEIEATATTAAATAAQFQGSDTKAQRERIYADAGFSQELATSFEPVWFEVFSDPIVGTVSIQATGETLVSASVGVKGTPNVELQSVKGKPGNRSYRVAVDVAFQPQWTTQTGNPRTESQYTATWIVTVDEATGVVTNVEQPAADEIPFRPEGE